MDPNDKWAAAAQHATRTINARSNSLYPYTLGGLTSVLLPDEDTAELQLQLQREHAPLAEHFKVVVKKEGGGYQLLHFEKLQEGQHSGQGPAA